MHKITKGLDLPVSGEPDQTIHAGPSVTQVGLIADDYIGMRPTMAVEEGETVKLGQVLFHDKITTGVKYTSPGAGKVVSITRGAKRKFESISIELEGDAQETFTSFEKSGVGSATADQVRETLVESGLWTALRTRPFSRVPSPTSSPNSIFVTAIDTNPLAANPKLIIDEHAELFNIGLIALTKLTEGQVYVCTAEGSAPGSEVERVQVEAFAGPHPAGLAGTHIHLLDPVGPNKTVWYVNYQDVIAYGHLMQTGQIMTDRMISMAGPVVGTPRIVKTRLGVNITELVDGELNDEKSRVVSGSLLSGRTASAPLNFLGRYHLQVSALHEGDERIFLGWQRPGFDKFSVTRVFASAFLGAKKFNFTTSTEGSKRAMVPIGSYEKVMPLDILPTFLLRALIVGDTGQAQELGALELDEDDLALCTYVCPGKYEYGTILRDNLTKIEKEG